MGGAKTTAVYPIGVVKKLTGLTERQIRYYDEKGLIAPTRTQGNQRLYSPVDVEKLMEVKRFIERGMSIRDIQEVFEKRREEIGRPDLARPLNYGERQAYFRRREPAVPSPQKAPVRTRAPSTTPRVDSKLRSLYPLSNRAELLKTLKEMPDDED